MGQQVIRNLQDGKYLFVVSLPILLQIPLSGYKMVTLRILEKRSIVPRRIDNGHLTNFVTFQRTQPKRYKDQGGKQKGGEKGDQQERLFLNPT